jgi:hypothetical protein
MTHQRLFPSSVGSREEAAMRVARPDPIRMVDDAVRSVLETLLRRSSPVSSSSPIFAERLFALRHAEALAPGTREVRVAPGTVVTPLALHALKQRGVALRFVSRGAVEQARRRGEWGFTIATESGLVTAFRRALLESAEPWVEHAELPDLFGWLTTEADRGAVLLTEEASVAVWTACRFDGIRAATAETCEAVDRAVRSLGVNLLVVEPTGKSIALLKQMCGTLRKGGAPQVPVGLIGE